MKESTGGLVVILRPSIGLGYMAADSSVCVESIVLSNKS